MEIGRAARDMYPEFGLLDSVPGREIWCGHGEIYGVACFISVDLAPKTTLALKWSKPKGLDDLRYVHFNRSFNPSVFANTALRSSG
jgi:hypothetical protein